MVKHWKKILITFLTIFLIVGGYIIYIFQFKEYDVADQELSEITKETYKLEMPDGTVIELDEDGNVVDSVETVSNVGTTSSSNSISGNTNTDETTSAGNISSSTGSNSKTGDSSKSGSTEDKDKNNSGSSNGGVSDSKPSSEPEKVTVATIKKKYTPTMSNLQTQANDRINALVGRAKQEYQSKKANGESVNYAYFYNKYTSAASELEGRTDIVFNQVVSIIEKELEANGYSRSHAQTFVNEYEAAKEARKSALLSKAMNRSK